MKKIVWYTIRTAHFSRAYQIIDFFYKNRCVCIWIWLNTLDGVEEWAVKKVIILFPHERTLWHIQLSACNQKSMASSSFIWAVIWNNWHKKCRNALLYNMNILKGIVCYLRSRLISYNICQWIRILQISDYNIGKQLRSFRNTRCIVVNTFASTTWKMDISSESLIFFSHIIRTMAYNKKGVFNVFVWRNGIWELG